jgi:hypothetical protein
MIYSVEPTNSMIVSHCLSRKEIKLAKINIFTTITILNLFIVLFLFKTECFGD